MLCYLYVDVDLTPEVTIFIIASVSVQYSVTTTKGLTPIWLQRNTMADVAIFSLLETFGQHLG